MASKEEHFSVKFSADLWF